MCNTCGCNVTSGNRHLLFTSPPKKSITAVSVLSNLLKHNDAQAELNRAKFDANGVLAINLMSSPGSGKTALLEATIRKLKEKIRIAVIEGDLETENDAERIRAQGVPAHQITTGTACHLDAHLIQNALDHLDLAKIDLLFIENVGNLVCPASHDLGEHLRVILLSVPEGDDKPGKYPKAFRTSQMMLVTKVDLLPYLPFSVDAAVGDALRIQPGLRTLSVSAVEGIGIAEWCEYLEQMRNRMLETSHASSCDL